MYFENYYVFGFAKKARRSMVVSIPIITAGAGSIKMAKIEKTGYIAEENGRSVNKEIK